MKLRNESVNMEIGITTLGRNRIPTLYIQEGNRQRVFASFLSEEKAKLFMELLKKWDENGGCDE